MTISDSGTLAPQQIKDKPVSTIGREIKCFV